MNRKSIFLTSLVVLLSCFSAANASLQLKFDLAVSADGNAVPYTDKSQQPGHSDWYALALWANDKEQHDGRSVANIGGVEGLNLSIGANNGSGGNGSVLDFTTYDAGDDPICNTWLKAGGEGGTVYLILYGPALIPGTYWVYGYHNTPGGDEPNMPRVYVKTYTSADNMHNVGATPDPDGGGVIADANDANVPIMHVGDDALLEPNVSLVKFYTDGSPVKITYENGAGSTAVLNAFIIEIFATGLEAGNPSPANKRTFVCPDTEISWEPGKYAQDVNGHALYFGTDLPDTIVLFDDSFESGLEPNWTSVGWVHYDANEDPNKHSGRYSASATVGGGLKTLTSMDINAVDTDVKAFEVDFWVRKTEAPLGPGELELYYYNGSTYNFIEDLNSLSPDVCDVWRHYTDNVTDSQYLKSNFRIQLRANISSGDAVYVDDVTVTNTWPVNPQWFVKILSDPCYNPPGYLDFGRTYYWRVDEVNDSCSPHVWRGAVWSFTTEYGKARNPDPMDGSASVESDFIEWEPSCLATRHDIYFSEDYNKVKDADTTSPFPDPYLGWVLGTSVNSGLVGVGKRYYWRIDESGPTTFPKGDIWTYQTRGTALMYYKFDGVIDANLPDPITDDTGNVTFDVLGAGELRYDEPNPLYNTLGTSARFTPNRELQGSYGGGVRYLLRSCFGPDMLDLDKDAYTIEAWVRQDGPAQHVRDDDMEGTVLRKDRFTYGLGVDDDGTVKFMHKGNVIESERDRRIEREEWHHIAAVYDASDPCQTEKLYIDGVIAADNNSPGPNPPDDYASDQVGIGAYLWQSGTAKHNSNQFDGAIDELRVSDIALGPDEFLIRGDKRLAWLPRPSNGRRGVPFDTSLLWNPGELASSHNVYFGTNWDDVNDATTASHPNVDYNNVDVNSYDPGLLDLATTYYWRVDEVNDTNSGVWRGYVWRFTTADFVTLDDFESYNKTNNLITYTWYCYYSSEYGVRSGARLSLSYNPVHGDEQAMKYEYLTDSAPTWDQDYDYADACLPLDEIDGFQDWTTVDVRLITIFFYGQAGNDTNDTEQMYMAVHNADGNYAEVRYGDHPGEDMNDLKVEEWQRWDVPFIWFTDSNAAVANDVDFSAISSVYLGFGNRRNPIPAGKGVVYFDDLRLSLPICKSELLKPDYDFSGNCIVDVADVAIMSDNWLRHDVNFADDLGIQVQPPPDANLLGHWKLDEGTGTFAEDSSVNHYHGTLEETDEGGYSWVTGHIGNAVDFSGGRVNVEDEGNTPNLRPVNQVSVCAWAYLDGDQESARVVVKGGNDKESYELEVNNDDEFVFQFRDANEPNNTRHDVNGMIWTDDWVHLAGTYDGSTIACYVNGELTDTEDVNNPWGLSQDPNGFAIGNKPKSDANDNPFEGIIDDVRVYDYGLSAAEVAWLATDGTGFIPLISEINIFSGERPEVINFRDFAKIFEQWGDEQLWPPEPEP